MELGEGGEEHSVLGHCVVGAGEYHYRTVESAEDGNCHGNCHEDLAVVTEQGVGSSGAEEVVAGSDVS